MRALALAVLVAAAPGGSGGAKLEELRAKRETLREVKADAETAYRTARDNVTALETQLREAKRTLTEAERVKTKAREDYAAAEQKVLNGLSSVFSSFGDSDMKTGDKATDDVLAAALGSVADIFKRQARRGAGEDLEDLLEDGASKGEAIV